MTWTAPPVSRAAEPYVGDERTMVEGWLGYHRQTLLLKCAGLTSEQLRTASVAPSGLTLLGLVRHMTDVERWWFRQRFAGQEIASRYWTETSPEGDFDDLADADAEADFAAFEAELVACRAAAAGHDLDETFTRPRRDGTSDVLNLRWIYLHMIEEYARHNGHADLLRERVDGTTGD